MAGPSANPGVGAHNASSARSAAVKPIVILIDGASNHPTRTRRLQIATPGRLARSAQAVDLLAGRWRIHSPPARASLSFTVMQEATAGLATGRRRFDLASRLPPGAA